MADSQRTYNDQAIVVRNHKLGEADRIITLLTADHGIVRAVAKGARRTTSARGAKLEPFRHVSVQLHRGRGALQTIAEVDVREHYRQLHLDLDRIETAWTLMEAASAMSVEGRADRRVYEMLAGALRTLNEHNSPLLLAAFLLKALAHAGLAPQLSECVAGPGCTDDAGAGDAGTGDAGAAAANLTSISIPRGGATCEAHRNGPAITDAALSVMRATLGGGLVDVLNLPQSPVTAEVSSLVQSMWEYQMERPLRSSHALS